MSVRNLRYRALAALTLAACSAGHAFPTFPTASTSSVLRATATETVLYSFQAGNDGADPLGTLTADPSGALYGTTDFGGGGSCFDGCGTVFKLAPSDGRYVETVLYRFQGSGSNDGSGPAAGVVMDSSGSIYGTTEYGGNASGDGTVFKLTPSGSAYGETVLYRFAGGNDGYAPIGGLTLDAKGNLYGATLLGGGASACPSTGCGTIFELVRSGSGYKERVLYRFQSGSDGATPGSPPVFVGKKLYGTAATGGGNPSCGGAPINRGCGTFYELTPARKKAALTVLHAFTGAPSDGANPFAGPIFKNGAFYVSTQYGGSSNDGSAVSLTPAGSHYSAKLLHSFIGGSDGSYPLAPLALGGHRILYGVTQYGGGSRNAGIAFALRSAHGGYKETVLDVFGTTAGGEYPVGGLLLGANGLLYGTTSYGGMASAAAGTVFSLNAK